VPTISIVNEGIDAMWWGRVSHTFFGSHGGDQGRSRGLVGLVLEFHYGDFHTLGSQLDG
jgi:hypothetical protein